MFYERALEDLTSGFSGTGPYLLNGPRSGFVGFVAAAGSGTIVAYFAQTADGVTWESGYGTITDGTPDTLSRNLLASSTGSLINWSAGAGKVIFSIPLADILKSIMATHQGAARPSWLPAKGMWIDTSIQPWQLRVYDGTDDIAICSIDPTGNTVNLAKNDQANTFTAAQTISVSSSGAVFTAISTDAGAGEGPGVILYRNSASPAANDTIGFIRFQGQDSGATVSDYVSIFAQLADPTASSEDARLIIRTARTGVDSDWYFESGSLRFGGVAQPANDGEINCSSYYDDGSQLRKATTAEMEAATNDGTFWSTPGNQHRHPGHPKATLSWNFASILTDYGVTSVADDGAGLWTPTFDTAFSAANAYLHTHSHMSAASNATGQYVKQISKTTTTCAHRFNLNGAATDVDEAQTAYFGDQ